MPGANLAVPSPFSLVGVSVAWVGRPLSGGRDSLPPVDGGALQADWPCPAVPYRSRETLGEKSGGLTERLRHPRSPCGRRYRCPTLIWSQRAPSWWSQPSARDTIPVRTGQEGRRGVVLQGTRARPGELSAGRPYFSAIWILLLSALALGCGPVPGLPP